MEVKELKTTNTNNFIPKLSILFLRLDISTSASIHILSIVRGWITIVVRVLEKRIKGLL